MGTVPVGAALANQFKV